MSFIYHDGGRKAAGYKGDTGDCVTRAIAIACDLPYQEAYDLVNALSKGEKPPKRFKGSGKSSARTGVYKKTTRNIMNELGLTWVPCMKVGQGCKVHLRPDELPKGKIIVSLSKHVAAVIDGVLYDTHDCSRGGTRCVYGYYIKQES